MADRIITPCGMWLWNHDVNSPSANPWNVILAMGWHAAEFARWQHPAMWQVALGWHAMEFAQTSAILEFYIWFRFWAYHRSRHVILHQSAKLYPYRTTISRRKWRHVIWWRISAILDFRGPIMGSLKSWCTTSYRSSIETIALNCLVFEKIAFFAFWQQTDRLTNRWTASMH